jgi:hypothetical protein
MDVLLELKELFEQVAIEKWITKLPEGITFRTEAFPLSAEEAKALLRKNRAVRDELPPASEETDAILSQVTTRLQEFLTQHFKTPNGIKAFAKLSDRSPKDATNLTPKIEALYEQKLKDPTIANVR